MLGPAWRSVGSAEACFGGRVSVVGEAGEVCARASGAAAGPKAQLVNVLGLRHGHVDQAQSAELLCACASAARRSAAAGGARVCMCLIVNKLVAQSCSHSLRSLQIDSVACLHALQLLPTSCACRSCHHARRLRMSPRMSISYVCSRQVWQRSSELGPTVGIL